MSLSTKLEWQGIVEAIQPRIRLLRSFDEVSHNYPGYLLYVQGDLGSESREFIVAIGKAAHAKHQFRVGDRAMGAAEPVVDNQLEIADVYKVSKLKIVSRSNEPFPTPPPFLGVPPDLTVYRERGHRRLDPRTYKSKCTTCIWDCEMPAEMLIDQWNPRFKYRRETFCYGPKSCPFYKAGPVRSVPGRKGMVWKEEDWIDEQNTAHRGPDD